MKNTLIGLHAQTFIHAGAGQSTGTIDLPIQRESHSDYPCIYGSGMKGALRACAEQRGTDSIDDDLFGPKSTENGYAGALLISDARLLLLPIRSLTTQFRWVTCPAILKRLKQDAARFDNELKFKVPSITSKKNENNQILIDKNNCNSEKLYLEEYCFDCKSLLNPELITVLASFIQCGIESNDDKHKLKNQSDALTLMKKQLAIISDDDFAYMARHATSLRARNVLTPQKTSENLWYEESLPPETIMYMGVAATAIRRKDCTTDAEMVMESFLDLFCEKPWLQVGGNETVGMGWFAVKQINSATSKE